jgi:hypothetical protein
MSFVIPFKIKELLLLYELELDSKLYARMLLDAMKMPPAFTLGGHNFAL